MPTLYILAGPNGTGKTTFYETASLEGFIDVNLPFINVDLIAKSLPGGYTSENFVKASEIIRGKLANHVTTLSDFMIESNLATQSDYDWINLVIKKGYEISLFFLSTSDVEININRVKKRVVEGGHDIPVPIIEHRYKMGHTYLKAHLHRFKKAYLIDNSSETPIVMAELVEGKIMSKNKNAPTWVKDVLYIIERIKH